MLHSLNHHLTGEEEFSEYRQRLTFLGLEEALASDLGSDLALTLALTLALLGGIYPVDDHIGAANCIFSIYRMTMTSPPSI